jgi:ribosomal protein S13
VVEVEKLPLQEQLVIHLLQLLLKEIQGVTHQVEKVVVEVEQLQQEQMVRHQEMVELEELEHQIQSQELTLRMQVVVEVVDKFQVQELVD